VVAAGEGERKNVGRGNNTEHVELLFFWKFQLRERKRVRVADG
jgi:hypothetical protein